MREPKNRFEHTHESASCCALLRLAATGELHFSKLDVPIAVFVPHKFIDSACRVIEAVLVEA